VVCHCLDDAHSQPHALSLASSNCASRPQLTLGQWMRTKSSQTLDATIDSSWWYCSLEAKYSVLLEVRAYTGDRRKASLVVVNRLGRSLPSHRQRGRFGANTGRVRSSSCGAFRKLPSSLSFFKSSSIANSVRPHAAPINPVSSWIGHDTTNPHTAWWWTKSDNCWRVELGISNLPRGEIRSECCDTTGSPPLDHDDEDDDDVECSGGFGCCEIRTPIRSAWTSTVAMAPPVERLQSNAFATLRGVDKTLINCFEPTVLDEAMMYCAYSCDCVIHSFIYSSFCFVVL